MWAWQAASWIPRPSTATRSRVLVREFRGHGAARAAAGDHLSARTARRDGTIEKGLESIGLRRGWNAAELSQQASWRVTGKV